MFPFAPKQQAQASAPAAPAAGPSPFAPPRAAVAGPIDVAQALQGFGDAPIDTRDPFLPVGFTGEIEIERTNAQVTRNLGLCLYAYAKVRGIASPGGGIIEGLKGCNPSPAVVGGSYAVRISGFNREDARAFAMSDLKAFMWALLEPEFRASGVATSAEVPAETWDKMAQAWAQGDAHFAGKTCLAQTSIIESKANFKKLKVNFYAKSAIGG